MEWYRRMASLPSAEFPCCYWSPRLFLDLQVRGDPWRLWRFGILGFDDDRAILISVAQSVRTAFGWKGEQIKDRRLSAISCDGCVGESRHVNRLEIPEAKESGERKEGLGAKIVSFWLRLVIHYAGQVGERAKGSADRSWLTGVGSDPSSHQWDGTIPHNS